MSVLAARDLSFSYGERPILAGVSFELEAGSMLGVVGPNGSGKTTLLRLLAGLERPSGGEALLLGRPVGSYARREIARLVAVVPQGGDAVFPYTTGEIVAMGRMPHLPWTGTLARADREACREAMERTDTLRLADRTLDRLSAGERQRVLIARALAQGAQVVLLDEASSFLDLGQELAIFRMLDGLRREEGIAFVSVSHDLNLVGAFCGRALLLREGRAVASGPLAEAFTGENLSALFGVPVETASGPGDRIRVQW